VTPESTATPVAPPSKTPKRSRWRKVLTIVIGLAVMAGTFAFILPQIADYGDVGGRSRTSPRRKSACSSGQRS
jgi:hypothetical protein